MEETHRPSNIVLHRCFDTEPRRAWRAVRVRFPAHAKDRNGCTALHHAAQARAVEVVFAILARHILEQSRYVRHILENMVWPQCISRKNIMPTGRVTEQGSAGTKCQVPPQVWPAGRLKVGFKCGRPFPIELRAPRSQCSYHMWQCDRPPSPPHPVLGTKY